MGLLLRHRQYAYHLDSWRELEEFRSFVDDAAVFVRHFGMPMAKSAPHIYLSALAFAPTCSLVSTHYATLFSRLADGKSAGADAGDCREGTGRVATGIQPSRPPYKWTVDPSDCAVVEIR